MWQLFLWGTYNGVLLFLSDIEFDFETGGYYPILYINDYWNLAQEYMPLNVTTP